MDTESLVEDAFAHLGVETRVLVGADAARHDLVIDPDGINAAIDIRRRSLVDGKTAERLLANREQLDAVLMVVGDRVTEEARRLLVAAGAGYLDRRGHLALRSKGLVISTDVPSVRDERDRPDALAGKVGLEVATRLLLSPLEPAAVRALARELGRSPSTVSDVLGGLRRDGLIDETNAVADTGLFWRVAEKWAGRRTYVAGMPPFDEPITAQALRLGIEDVEATAGWALTDTAAAAAYGAPVAFRSGQQLDFLVPDGSVVQRAGRLLGIVPSASQAAISIRVTPVPIATGQRVEPEGGQEWPLAHPLFVALDLAQDVGRGREILDAWNPGERWSRVW